MAHCELHGAIVYHYKTTDLMNLLKIKRYAAVGIRACVYGWAIDNRPGGRFERGLIATACEWDGQKDELLKALVDARLIHDHADGTVEIHDWPDYVRWYLKSKKDYARRLGKEPPADWVCSCRQGKHSSATLREILAETVKLPDAAPANTVQQDARVGVISHLLALAHAAKCPSQESTQRKHLEALVERVGAEKVEEYLSSPSGRGKTVNDWQEDLTGRGSRDNHNARESGVDKLKRLEKLGVVPPSPLKGAKKS